MKDLGTLPAPTRADHKDRIDRLFRLIHSRSAKTIFGLGGTLVMLPALAEAQVSPAQIRIDDVTSIREYEIRPDGTIRATLTNGQKVLITSNNIFIGADGSILISELAAEELLLASDSAYGMLGVSTNEALLEGVTSVFGVSQYLTTGSLLTKTLKVIDAPLEGALVFYDGRTSLDGQPQEAEYLGLTDENGAVTFSYDPVPGGKFLVIPAQGANANEFGWSDAFIAQFDGVVTRDVVTDNSFTQVLQAADTQVASDQIVSPLSTLVQTLADADGISTAEAAAKVKSALDIPEDVDLDSFDFVAGLEDAGTAEDAQAVLAAATTIANIVDAALAAAGTEENLDGTELTEATDDAMAAVAQTLAEIADAKEADAGFTPTINDVATVATAVAVTKAAVDTVDDDGAEAIAEAAVANLAGGAAANTAAQTAIEASDQVGDDDADATTAAVNLGTTLGNFADEVDTFFDGLTTDGLTETAADQLDQTIEDDLTDDVAAIVNEQILGISLVKDTRTGEEHQSAPIKGNLLANDTFVNGEGLTSTTVLYSVEGALVPGQDTSSQSDSFLISTADWGTETPTVTASSLRAGLVNPGDDTDTMGAMPAARNTGGAATKGSAIYTTLTVSQADADAGATLSFDYNFGSYDYLPYNDYSFVAIHATAGGTATEQAGTVLRGEGDGPADVQDLKGTGWYTLDGEYADTDTYSGSTADGSFSYTFTEAGTYQIAIGVTDVRDAIFDSFISVDNIDYQVNGTSSATQPDFDAEDFRGNVEADTANDGDVEVLFVTGSYGQLIVTEGGDYLYQVGTGANVEDIPEGDTVTENFKYTVQLDDGRLASSQLNILLTGVEEQEVSLQVNADTVNAESEEAYDVSGTLVGANLGDQIQVSVTGTGTAPSVVTINVTNANLDNGTAFWSTGEMDLSGLADGTITVTASLVGSDVQTEISGIVKDTTADAGDDFAISYSDAPTEAGGTLEFTITGLDADTTATLLFEDGSGGELEVPIDADGTYTPTLPAGWDNTAEITASVQLSDDVGNQEEADLPGFFAPNFTVTVNGDGEINGEDQSGSTVSLSTNAPAGTSPQLVALSLTDGTNTVDVTVGLPLDLSSGSANLSGIDLSSLDDGAITVSAEMQATLADSSTATVTASGSATLDSTADADPAVTATLTDDIDDAADTEVTVALDDVDADVTSVTITFTDGSNATSPVSFANGSATVDLTGLDAAKQLTSEITITDAFGNIKVMSGPVTSLGDLPTVALDALATVSDAAKGAVTITGATTNATVSGVVDVTVSDGVNTDVTGQATVQSDGTYSVTLDLSGLDDGTLDISATVEATVGGSTVSGDSAATGQVTLDTTAEGEGDTAAASLSDDISGEGDTSVTVQLDLSTLDADVSAADATVTFSDGTTTTSAVSFDATGEAVVDLSGLVPNTALTSEIIVTDAVGNTHSFAGPGTALVQLPDLTLDDLGVINAAGAAAATVSGQTDLTAGTVDITISDGANPDVTGQATVQSDGSFSLATLDVTSLDDGALTVTATATGTIGGGEVTSAPATDDRTLDTDADVGDDLTVSITTDLAGVFDTEVTAEITSGLDADVDPTDVTITFSDGTNTAGAAFAADGTVTVDLSSLDSSQPITSEVTATDAAGNTATSAGPSTAFNTAAIYNATQDLSYTADQLQQAVADADPGDVLELAAGDITGDVSIDKSLTLMGAHNGTAAADASDPSSMDPEGRGGESTLTGTITVAAANVVIDGVKLDNDAPLTWDESILTGNEVDGWGNELDGFQLMNSVMTTYVADGAPTFGPTNATYAGPTMASDWVISGNLIGGVSEGNAGALYLAGLEDSSVSGNVFWRPTAGHLYLSSMTNVDVDGNFFYHGVHGNGVSLDGLGDAVGADATYYGALDPSATQAELDALLGRNFWIEVKGTNTDLDITNNDGQYNSGGIQLYGENGDETFDGVTISGNTFRDFINADPGGALADGQSGFLGAIAVSTVAPGSQITDLTITDNTIDVARDQIFSSSDQPAAVYVNGVALDGDDADTASVTMTGNDITLSATSSSEILAAQAVASGYDGLFQAVYVGSGVADGAVITGNTITDGVGNGTVAGVVLQGEADVFGATGLGLDELTADVMVTSNTITGFDGGTQNTQILAFGMDLTQDLDALDLQVPATLVLKDDSDQPEYHGLTTGTTGDDTHTMGSGNQVFVTRGGQDTVDLSAGGTHFVALDAMDSDGDLVSITGFTTGDSSESDGLALYNLTQSDLRGDGSELLHITQGGTVNANSAVLVFTDDVDVSTDAAGAIEAAVESLSGLAAGDVVLAIAGTGTDAALVRVEMTTATDGTATHLADVTLATGSLVDDFAAANLATPDDLQVPPVF